MMKIFIVDDHYIVREGIRMVLELEDEFDIVGEAENGLEALQLLEHIDPDVVLLDLNMPQLDGISFLRKLKQQERDVRCIVLTTYKDEHLLVEAVKLGVRSYILKDAGREVIYETIQRVVAGETWFPAEIETLLNASLEKESMGITLSSKEVTILKSLAKGMKNSEIAAQLFVSERTIKGYLTVIYEKLHVKTRAQAIAVAIEKKYL